MDLLQAKTSCFLIFVATLAVISAQKRVYSENKVVHDGSTVLLGGLFPISENEDNTCGQVRTTAVEAIEAMVFAIRKVNENRTLLPNVNLTFDVRDTCSIPNKALEQSLSFVQSPVNTSSANKLAVSGIVGAGFFSHVSEAVASLFRLFQIPQISYGSSASILSDRVRFDYFFRTLPSDSFLARAMADAVNYFNWSYIIVLHSDDRFGTNGADIIVEKIQNGSSGRACVAIRISLPMVGSSDDFDNVVEKMSQPWVRNATVALLYGYKVQTEGIMGAIQRRLKKFPNSPLQYLTWVGCEALRVRSRYHPLIRGMIRNEIRVTQSEEFHSYFTSLNARNHDNPYFREYWEVRFNCSLQQTTCDAFPSEFYPKSEISSIIDAVYAFAHAIHGLIEEHCPNGDLCRKISVTRSAGIAINGTMIRDYLLHNLSFPGLSSDIVRFDAEGNDRSSYNIKNLQKVSRDSYEYKTIGTWKPDTLLNFTADVEWNGDRRSTPESVCSKPCANGTYVVPIPNQASCCWSCQTCLGDKSVSTGDSHVCKVCGEGYSPNEQKSECVKNRVFHLTWSNPWTVIILLCSCLGIIATISVIVVYIAFNKHAAVKASSRELSAILLMGLLLCYILPFSFVAKPSEATCGIRRFIVGFSFSVCFSAVLVKTNRLHRIFNRSPEQLKVLPRFISPLSQVIITFILISVQVVIAILWLSIDRPSTELVYDTRVIELKCGESSDVGLIISLGYSFLLLILSTYFAFLARKIPENFNEAKFINITLYTIIIIWLAFVPTYFGTARLGSVFQTCSLVIAIILSATTTLCCLFAPKVFFLLKQVLKEKRESKDVTSTTNGITTVTNGDGATKISLGGKVVF